MRKMLLLGKGCVQDAVELLGRLQIAAKRLFDNDACTLGRSGVRQMFDNGTKERRRNGQVVRRMLSSAQLFTKRVKSGTVRVVAIDIAQQTTQLLEGCGVQSAVLFQTVLSPGAKLVEFPARFRDPDDRHIEASAFDQRLQCGKDFLVGEIAGGTKKDQRV